MIILLRYYDMLIVMKSNKNHKVETKKKETITTTTTTDDESCCSICFMNDKDMVVMSPCSHRICTTCFQLWVSKKLKCPFCRYEFKSNDTLQRDSWDMISKFEYDSIYLATDIKTLESRLLQFRNETISKEEEESFTVLKEYVTKERLLQIKEEEGEEEIIIEKSK